jgi:hypothetical protein
LNAEVGCIDGILKMHQDLMMADLNEPTQKNSRIEPDLVTP